MKLKFRMLLAASLLLLIYACNKPTTDEAPPTKYEFTTVAPDEAGFSVDSLAKLDGLLQASVDSQWVAGSVALIAKDGKIVYHKSFGQRDMDAGDAMATDDLFRIASMTKPITSLAILQLVEQGKLAFDDPVERYIPEFANLQILESLNNADTSYTSRPASTTLTIHHLLTHTAGIAYSFTDTTLNNIYQKGKIVELATLKPTKLEGNIAKLAQMPVKHEPGEKWTYGLGIDVLGRVIEVVSGLPFDEYLKRNIFTPLGMDDTGFYFGDDMAGRLTTMYSNDAEAKIKPFPHNPENDFTGQFPIMGAKTYFSGGGGLTSTATDYLRFCQMVLNDGELNGVRVIGAETLRHMKENKIGDLRVGRDYFSYGYAITAPDGDLRYNRKPGRLSWGGAFQTTFWIDQERKIIAMMLTQVYPSYHQNKLYHNFETAVSNAIVE